MEKHLDNKRSREKKASRHFSKWVKRTLCNSNEKNQMDVFSTNFHFTLAASKSSKDTSFFFKLAFPGLFFFIFVFSGLQLTDNYVRIQIYHCRCWDSNHGSLVSEATTLPTVPQPRPYIPHSLVLSIKTLL